MSSKSTSWAIEQQGLSPTSKLVLIIMADSASATGITFASNKTIATLAGFSREDTVSESQVKLIAMNMIADTGKRVGSTGRVKVFQLPAPACHTAPCLEDLMCFGNPALNGSLNPEAIPGESPANPRRIPGLTGLPLKGELGTRKRERGKPLGFDASSFPLPKSLATDQFKQTWCEWVADRKQRRKTITECAAKLQLAALEKMGAAKAVESIRQSIANGWTGLFEPKQDQRQFQRQPRPPVNICQPWGSPL